MPEQQRRPHTQRDRRHTVTQAAERDTETFETAESRRADTQRGVILQNLNYIFILTINKYREHDTQTTEVSSFSFFSLYYIKFVINIYSIYPTISSNQPDFCYQIIIEATECVN